MVGGWWVVVVWCDRQFLSTRDYVSRHTPLAPHNSKLDSTADVCALEPTNRSGPERCTASVFHPCSSGSMRIYAAPVEADNVGRIGTDN